MQHPGTYHCSTWVLHFELNSLMIYLIFFTKDLLLLCCSVSKRFHRLIMLVLVSKFRLVSICDMFLLCRYSIICAKVIMITPLLLYSSVTPINARSRISGLLIAFSNLKSAGKVNRPCDFCTALAMEGSTNPKHTR